MSSDVGSVSHGVYRIVPRKYISRLIQRKGNALRS